MSLRTDVYEQLKDRLLAGELRTGQFVSQRELADLVGATLNPVREAIRKLEAEGLINVYAQRGIQIVEGGPKAINDTYDYRLLLETNAVKHLITRAGAEEIAAIAVKVEQSLAANPGLKSQLAEAYRLGVALAVDETELERSAFPVRCPYDWDTVMSRPIEE